MSKKTRRIMYLRSTNKSPIGCVALSFNRERGVVRYNLSVLNPVDKFERSLARHIALGRLLEMPRKVVIAPDASMNDISYAVMNDIASSTKLPHRAIRAARRWLKSDMVDDQDEIIVETKLDASLMLNSK